MLSRICVKASKTLIIFEVLKLSIWGTNIIHTQNFEVRARYKGWGETFRSYYANQDSQGVQVVVQYNILLTAQIYVVIF